MRSDYFLTFANTFRANRNSTVFFMMILSGRGSSRDDYHMKKKQAAEHKTIEYTRSISFRLLRNILLVSSFITLLITVFQLFLDYKKDVSLLEDQFRQIEVSHLQSISMAFYNLGEEEIKTQLNGLLEYRDIIQLEIRELDGNRFMVAGGPRPEKCIIKTFPISYRKDVLGFLEITATMSGVYQRLYDKILIILTGQTLKTFIVSIFILFIIRQLLIKHLAVLGQYAKQLDLTRLGDPLVLKRKPKKGADELDLVVSAINDMRMTLQKSTQALKDKARMEGELNAAASIQRSMMPYAPPQIKGWDLASVFVPALEVSGDYFDFIRIDPHHLGLVVADASGKGLAAALHANAARVLLKDKTALHVNPKALFSSLNCSLENEFPPNQFLTMGYALVETDTGKVTWVSAGHEPAVLKPSFGNGYRLIKPLGFPFCQLFSPQFESRMQLATFTMSSGDLLVLYTDGLTDAVNETNDRFGEERLCNLIHDLHGKIADQIVKTITQSVREFQGESQQTDDMTMIVLRRL